MPSLSLPEPCAQAETEMNAIDPAKMSQEEQRELRLRMERASPAYFASKNLRGPLQAPYNGRFIIGKHHVEWDEICTTKDRACIIAPRDHGKSGYWNKAYPIWRSKYGRPDSLGYIFSVNQEKATEMLQLIVEELTQNPKLNSLVPMDWERRWSKKRIRLTTGVELRARGFGVKVRGGHPDFVICDDILSDENISSETVRNKAIDYFLSAITNMVVPGGQIFVAGTPFHEADLYAHLAQMGAYTMWRRAAIDPVTGDPLWPARYPLSLLEARRAEIQNVRFTREFLCRPFSDDMSLFPTYLFDGEPTRQYSVKMGMPAAFWEELGIKRYVGVDLAMSSETGADFFVIFVLGIDNDGNRWVIDIYREKGLPFRRQLDLIVEHSRRYDASLVFVEANAAQRVWGDELIRTTDIPIKKFTTIGRGKGSGTAMSQTANKNDLEKGVPSLRPLLENKKFRIPMGDTESVEKARSWIGEMNAFSFVNGKVQGVGSKDDQVMGLFLADQAARRGGFSASFGDEPDFAELARQRLAKHGITPSNGKGTPTPDDYAEASAQNASGASGNLGAVDLAEPLWSAIPFYERG